MKSTIKIVAGGVLAGLLLGLLLGLVRMTRARWDISMENDSYYEEQVAKAQEEADAAASGKIKAPRVQIDEIQYDFGVMPLNDETKTGSHDFIIRNTGTETLKLKEKDKTCFCTNFSIAQKTLAPGEETICTVTWDGHSGGGDFKQTVVLSSNDPQAPEFFFNIKGLYTSPIICNPNHLLFNGISSGKEETQKFHILGFSKTESGEPFPLEFSDFEISDPEHFILTVEKGSLDEMTQGEKENKVFAQATSVFNGTLTIKPGLPQGAFQEVIRLKTNFADLPILELMVEGKVSGTVTISGAKYDKHGTGQLMIGSVSSRNTTTETIRLDIVNPELIASAETVRVLRQNPGTDTMKIEFQYPPEEAQKSLPVKMIPVKIEIPAGAPQGRYSGPGLTETGEIVFGIGAGENPQEIVLPVNFTVGP